MPDLDAELRALHLIGKSQVVPNNAESFWQDSCEECYQKWPCSTIQLLDKHKERE